MKELEWQENKNKIKISNPLFGIYLTYIFIVLGCDAVDVVCYVFGWKQTSILSRIIVLSLCIIVLYKFLPYIKIEKKKIEWKKFIGVLVLLVLGIGKSVYPDTAYDTLAYHLTAQNPGFVNYFQEDFAKGNFQVWGFRLGDKLFYPFRYLLGYRFGTLLNVFILILIYLQIYDILSRVYEKYGKKQKDIVSYISTNKVIWALLLTLMQDAAFMIGLYYVDILAVPIGIGVMSQLIEAVSEEQKPVNIIYYAALNGIWFALKMTNIIYIIPCVIIYIYYVRKTIDIRCLGKSALAAAFPCCIYLIYNYVSTGNPVFPYFNGLFKSEFFAITNFKDGRWGGENLFQQIFWFIFLIFKPNYRQEELAWQYNSILIVGFVGLVLMLIMLIELKVKKQKVDTRLITYILVFFSSSVLWGITTGYSRYFIFGMILLGGCAYCLILKLDKNKIMRMVNIVIVVFLVGSLTMTMKDIFSGREYSFNTWKYDTFCKQLSKVFKDYDNTRHGITDDLGIDMFYITDNYYGAMTELYDKETYMFNACYKNYVQSNKVVEKEIKSHQKLFEGNIYDIKARSFYDIVEYAEKLDGFGMYIDDLNISENDIGKYVLIKLKQTNKTNKVFFSGKNVEIACNENKNAKLEVICGRIYGWDFAEECNLVIKKVKGTSSEEIYCEKMKNEYMGKYIIPVGMVDCDTEIVIEIQDSQGNPVGEDIGDNYFIINPEIM